MGPEGTVEMGQFSALARCTSWVMTYCLADNLSENVYNGSRKCSESIGCGNFSLM